MSALDALQEALLQLRSGALGASGFCATARAQTSLLAQLPARYGAVLEQLLERLETSALFTEESCSFSQRDLQDALQAWIDHARTTAGQAAG